MIEIVDAILQFYKFSHLSQNAWYLSCNKQVSVEKHLKLWWQKEIASYIVW